MKHLAAVIALLLFTIAARAEAPVCSGADLVAAMKDNDPAAYAEVLREAAAIPNGEALLWKIERDGLKPSFLMGTAHVTDPRVTALPRGVEDIIRNASVIALELAELRSAADMATATLKNAALLVLPPGQSLWDLIPDADEQAIRNHPNLPLGSATGIYGYRPWVVAGMLSIPLCESRRKLSGIATLDEVLGAIAVTYHVPLVGLETVAEQLSVFAELPLELQAKYLVAVARLGPAIDDYFETLIRLYQQRRITAYMPFARRAEKVTSPGDQAMMTFVEETLIRTRNHRMAERAAGLFAKGNAFVAVGALHLPGDEGLVALIRRQDYKVTPLN